MYIAKFKRIPGFESYGIDIEGNVIEIKTQKKPKVLVDKCNAIKYVYIDDDNGIRFKKSIFLLLSMTYVGINKYIYRVVPKDGDVSNINVNNIHFVYHHHKGCPLDNGRHRIPYFYRYTIDKNGFVYEGNKRVVPYSNGNIGSYKLCNDYGIYRIIPTYRLMGYTFHDHPGNIDEFRVVASNNGECISIAHQPVFRNQIRQPYGNHRVITATDESGNVMYFNSGEHALRVLEVSRKKLYQVLSGIGTMNGFDIEYL